MFVCFFFLLNIFAISNWLRCIIFILYILSVYLLVVCVRVCYCYGWLQWFKSSVVWVRAWKCMCDENVTVIRRSFIGLWFVVCMRVCARLCVWWVGLRHDYSFFFSNAVYLTNNNTHWLWFLVHAYCYDNVSIYYGNYLLLPSHNHICITYLFIYYMYYRYCFAFLYIRLFDSAVCIIIISVSVYCTQGTHTQIYICHASSLRIVFKSNGRYVQREYLLWLWLLCTVYTLLCVYRSLCVRVCVFNN